MLQLPLARQPVTGMAFPDTLCDLCCVEGTTEGLLAPLQLPLMAVDQNEQDGASKSVAAAKAARWLWVPKRCAAADN